MLAVVLLSVGSCATNSDIDDLQDQLDGLENQVDLLEEAQREELLAEISVLEGLIAELQASNSDLETDYETLLQSLNDLEEEIASGAVVFYGNVLTDADFAKVVSEGASIITGNVVVSSQTNADNLSLVKMIGGSMTIQGGANVVLPALEGVSDEVMIMGVDDSNSMISMPMLKTIGSDLEIANNDGLGSIDMPELVLIHGDFDLRESGMLTDLTMAKLDLINGSLDIDNMDPNSYGSGMLSNLNLSSTDVNGAVTSRYLGMDSELALGLVTGDLVVDGNGFVKLEVLNETFEGSITISNNGSLEEISFPNMTKVEGDIVIQFNVAGGFIGGATSKLTNLSCFDSLTSIGGSVDVSGNMFPEFDAFNNVKTVAGNTIRLNENGQEKTLVNVFNNLTGTGSWGTLNIDVTEKTEWFTGFAKLTKAKEVNLMIVVTQDANWNQGTVAKIDGFDLLEEVYSLNFNAQYATEVNAFPVLNKLTKYGEYLRITMPVDTNVKMCSMSTMLTKVKDGGFDNQWSTDVKAVFWDGWNWMEIDRDTAIDTLLEGCN